jgi:hypothetical protein
MALQVPLLLAFKPHSNVATFAMYPKWFAFILTLLSCLFLMASAAPVAGGELAPVKRLKQFQLRRPSTGDTIVARG